MKFKVKDLRKCVSKAIVIPVGIEKYSNKVLEFSPDRHGREGVFMYDDWYFEAEWLEPVEEVAAPTKETTESRPEPSIKFVTEPRWTGKEVQLELPAHLKVHLPTEGSVPETMAGKVGMIDSILNPKSEDSEDESRPTLLALPPESAKGNVFTSIHDAVSRPDHYHFSEYEPVKVIQAWGLSFCLGNVVKYIARAGRKDSSKLIEDLEKAKRYIELELEDLRKK